MPRLWMANSFEKHGRRTVGVAEETESPDGEQQSLKGGAEWNQEPGCNSSIPTPFRSRVAALRASDCKLNTFRARTNAAAHRTDKLSANRFPYVRVYPVRADTDFLARRPFLLSPVLPLSTVPRDDFIRGRRRAEMHSFSFQFISRIKMKQSRIRSKSNRHKPEDRIDQSR